MAEACALHVLYILRAEKCSHDCCQWIKLRPKEGLQVLLILAQGQKLPESECNNSATGRTMPPQTSTIVDIPVTANDLLGQLLKVCQGSSSAAFIRCAAIMLNAG